MIAVVGLGCRFPEADDPGQLWDSVLTRRRSFRRMPSERLDLAEYYDADPQAEDKTYSTRAALLEGWEFDRSAFRVPGPVHRATDPAHWLALETAARALADAGFPGGEGLARDRVAVVIGNTLTGEMTRAATLRARWPYVRRILSDALSSGFTEEQRADVLARAEAAYRAPFEPVGDETLAGGLANTIAGRICNHFDFNGGGYTVDGACASSLLAVVDACTQLADGSCDFALAGGVDLSLDPFELVGFAKAGALARTAMRVYDERAEGFWPGEGCGVVALMRASDARSLGIPAYAEIAGWGVSSDGAGGMTRPERSGQMLAVRRACERAGISPTAVGLYEGHGTGTAVGDETELSALLTIRQSPATTAEAASGASPGSAVPSYAVLGSVKANIGHTKAAAGAAGLIKAAMSIASGILPPATACDRPHALLRDSSLRILHTPEPWPDGDRIAGVSAMGFGGINTHVILRTPTHPRHLPTQQPPLSEEAALSGETLPAGEALPPKRTPALTGARTPTTVAPSEEPLFAFAADTLETLRTTLDRVATIALRLSEGELHDLAASLTTPGNIRAAFAAGTVELLAQRARQAAALLQNLPEGKLATAAGVYAGNHVKGRVTLLFPGQGAPVGTTDTAQAQPAIYTASLQALARLNAMGVTAQAAIGHSLGEFAGLVWAGCLDPDEGLRLVKERGKLMSELGDPATGMVAIAADQATAEHLCAGTGLVIAAYNGPHAHVLAGPTAEVEEAARRAQENGLPARILPVTRAFHSPAVAECAGAFKSCLADTTFAAPERRLISTVAARAITDLDALADLLCDQITAPVLFGAAVREVLEDTDLFCEVGPGTTLSGLVTDVPAALDDRTPAAPGVPGNQAAGVPAVSSDQAAAALFAAGAIDGPLGDGRPVRPIDIWRERTFLTNPCSIVAVQRPVRTAEPVVEAGDDVRSVVLRVVAQATELAPEAITPSLRLLSDLHLTSLRVARVVAEAARLCGRRPPMAPLTMADASIAEVVTVIEALPPGEESDGDDLAGVAPWIGCFIELPEPTINTTTSDANPATRGVTSPTAGPDPAVPGPAGSVPGTRPGAGLGISVTGPAVSDPADPGALPVLLEVARAGVRLGRLEGTTPGLSGFFRTLQYEYPALDVALPAGRHQLVDPAPGDLPVGPGDVVLVSGGGKGIGYVCAAALARATGAALALLGRSRPEDDETLAANLTALEDVAFAYESADVTDAPAVAAAVQRLAERLGPITGIVHASGLNEPKRFADVTLDDLVRHWAPKVSGLHHLLAAVSDPRLVVTFGSVIGRYGMAGESAYALANGALRAEVERLATQLPDSRVVHVDWSLWSGAGMGERLGVVEALLRAGVMPITPADGAEWFLRVIAAGNLPAAVAVHGRVGAEAPWAAAESPRGRFMETARVHYPGVELVAEARLDLLTDPFLGDHRIDGLVVVPAVVCLEAMAQAASSLAGRALRTAESVSFDQPVIVPDDGTRTVRVCALRRDGAIEVVVRSDETAYRADHARATFPLTDLREDRAGGSQEDRGQGATQLDPADLYGKLFFHTGRFRRVTGLAVTATTCRAELGPPDAVWFDALLGGPTLNDATIHALQACVPDRRLLPVACDRVSMLPHANHLAMTARERTPGSYVWDVTAQDPEGREVVRWEGLRLKDAGALPRTEPWQPDLLAVHLERTAIALGLDPALRVGISRRERSLPPGRPQEGVSRSHVQDLTLTVSNGYCDWEPVGPAEPGHRDLVEHLAARCDEPLEQAASRVWTAVECLSKAGRPPTDPLVLKGVYEGGWAVLRSGGDLIASGVVDGVAVAIMTGEAR
ncbi:SDR family NAD(P)-dependent oxidoreductase [Nonomuraea sp. NPDC050556]|uniref:SDR family NAD(P)-dependent oxidoreductase n=1 Tax=Nonomuraea sp. NPDC050556 TaxID=3364369 RepID=UPI00378D250E